MEVSKLYLVFNLFTKLIADWSVLTDFVLFFAAAEIDASLKWIIDLTIAYPNGNPLDIMTIFFASVPPCNVVFHYRCYPISEVMCLIYLLRKETALIYPFLVDSHGQWTVKTMGLWPIHREGIDAGHVLLDRPISRSSSTQRILRAETGGARRFSLPPHPLALHQLHSVSLETAYTALLFGLVIGPTHLPRVI